MLVQHRHFPSLVLNLDTLGQSEIVMPRDETSMDAEIVTESAKSASRGKKIRKPGNRRTETQAQAWDTIGGGAGLVKLKPVQYLFRFCVPPPLLPLIANLSAPPHLAILGTAHRDNRP